MDLKNKREKAFLPFKTQLFHIQVVRYAASENNRHPAKMHRNNTAVVFFSRHIWSFPTFFRNLTDRTAPDIRHSGNRFGRLCLNLKNRDNR
ncbi:MAG: hypothetical protein ACLUGU_09460 [Alistipes shahii]